MFLSIPKILELGFGRIFTLITTKFKLWEDCVKHIVNPSAFIFFLFDRCYMILPCYLHGIHNFHHLHIVKMVFLSYFLFAHSKLKIWQNTEQT